MKRSSRLHGEIVPRDRQSLLPKDQQVVRVQYHAKQTADKPAHKPDSKKCFNSSSAARISQKIISYTVARDKICAGVSTLSHRAHCAKKPDQGLVGAFVVTPTRQSFELRFPAQAPKPLCVAPVCTPL